MGDGPATDIAAAAEAAEAAGRDCGERCDALQRQVSSALQWSRWCGAAVGEGERRVQRERSGAQLRKAIRWKKSPPEGPNSANKKRHNAAIDQLTAIKLTTGKG